MTNEYEKKHHLTHQNYFNLPVTFQKCSIFEQHYIDARDKPDNIIVFGLFFFEEISAIWELFPAMITQKFNEFNVSTNQITIQKPHRIFTIFSPTPETASSISYFPLRVTFHVLSLSHRIIFLRCSDEININIKNQKQIKDN